MALVGYARVSTEDQTAEQQLTALRAVGCTRLFRETASGVSRSRPELALALSVLRRGDVLVVARIDRLARSLSHLLEIVDGLNQRGVGFRSLADPIDTTSPQGRLTLQILGAVAEFERALIAERTKAGLARAAAQGRRGGNPGLRAGDHAALRRLAEARAAARVERIIAAASPIIPAIRELRPDRSWTEMAHMLTARGAARPDGRPWTPDSLVRVCRALVREGLLEADVLDRARPASSRKALVTLVASLHGALERPTLAAIAAQLKRLRVATPRGGTTWSPSSVRHLLQAATEQGLVAGRAVDAYRRSD